MDWIYVLTISSFTIGAVWFMHRESYNEMKDFHGRLCRLEEKYIQLLEKEIKSKMENRSN